jgi:hypothetical protein
MKKLKFKWYEYGNYGHVVDIPKAFNQDVFPAFMLRIIESTSPTKIYLTGSDCFGVLFNEVIDKKDMNNSKLKEAKLKAEDLFLKRVEKFYKKFQKIL